MPPTHQGNSSSRHDGSVSWHSGHSPVSSNIQTPLSRNAGHGCRRSHARTRLCPRRSDGPRPLPGPGQGRARRPGRRYAAAPASSAPAPRPTPRPLPRSSAAPRTEPATRPARGGDVGRTPRVARVRGLRGADQRGCGGECQRGPGQSPAQHTAPVPATMPATLRHTTSRRRPTAPRGPDVDWGSGRGDLVRMVRQGTPGLVADPAKRGESLVRRAYSAVTGPRRLRRAPAPPPAPPNAAAGPVGRPGAGPPPPPTRRSDTAGVPGTPPDTVVRATTRREP